MRSVLFAAVLIFMLAQNAPAATDKIIKVLPQYMDAKGRTSLSPSLYDRDAYQARLRRHPEDCLGMTFQVQWKAKSTAELKMFLEVRGSKAGQSTSASLQTPVKHLGGLNRWTPLVIKDAAYNDLGEITAWRVSLWQGDTFLAEQKSFLW
ncbi:MAG TPA: hypothetical protein VMZ27_03560 [Candidatus Saccharimonadales bacterium]|nr:hypothetical protein [Candidatus Saccharimonadales bacterium]